jgi:aspartate 1-decarboxylase
LIRGARAESKLWFAAAHWNLSGHLFRIPAPSLPETSMLLNLLQAKLHRVRVTQADLDYEGSCGIDANLLRASGLRVNQHIDIYNVSNGERFSTYIITAPAGSGEISLNGAAARKAMIGDYLIICAYSAYSETEAQHHQPVVILVDEHNQPRAGAQGHLLQQLG